MADSHIPVAGTTHNLETARFTNDAGTLVDREGVFIGDPDTFGAKAGVDALAAALRTLLVDSNGDFYSGSNPLPIDSPSTYNAANRFAGFGEVDIGSASDNVDIWRGPTNVQPEPNTSGFQPSVVSSSANDTAAGTGVRTVSIHYLDTSGAQFEEIVTMNGTTPVQMVATNVMFINEFHTETVGTGLVADGNIDVYNPIGSVVYNRILASGNWSLSTMRQVPAGKILYVTGWHGVGTAGQAKESILRIRSTNHDSEVYPGVYLFKDTTRVKDNPTPNMPFDPALIVPALATIKISAWTTGAINVAASWNGWLGDA